MALPPTALQLLLDAATSADHLFELLRLAGCLTPRGRANRSMVTGMMTRAREQFEPPYTMGNPGFYPHTCPGVWEAIAGPLTSGGYLQMSAWPDAWKYITTMSVEERARQQVRTPILSDPSAPRGYVPMTSVEERVHEIIDKAVAFIDSDSDDDMPWLYQADEQKRARRRATAEPGPLSCPACRKALPDEAQFCVWCRADLPFVCSCQP